MDDDARELAGDCLEHLDLILAEGPSLDALDGEHPEGIAPMLERHPKEGAVALLAGLGKVLVARVAGCVPDGDRLALFDDEAGQALLHRHGHRLDRFGLEAHGGFEPKQIDLQEVDRADLGAHPVRHELDDLVQQLPQRVGPGDDLADDLQGGELFAGHKPSRWREVGPAILAQRTALIQPRP